MLKKGHSKKLASLGVQTKMELHVYCEVQPSNETSPVEIPVKFGAQEGYSRLTGAQNLFRAKINEPHNFVWGSKELIGS